MLGLAELSIKRDDCTGLALGGNKVRQHEFILGEAIDQGYDTIIQGAGPQSNHSRQIAGAGARLGLAVHILSKSSGQVEPMQGNRLISGLLGARIHSLGPTDNLETAKADLASELRASGKKPLIIGVGSERSLALAAIAYVNAFLEIAQHYETRQLPQTLFTASQCSTQAGLLLGALTTGLPIRVVGINPLHESHEAFLSRADIAHICRLGAEILGLRVTIDDADVENTSAYVGSAYGDRTPEGDDALRFLARTEGILLDPVYTAKALAGLIDICQQDSIERALMLHTGGVPVIFARADDLGTELFLQPPTTSP